MQAACLILLYYISLSYINMTTLQNLLDVWIDAVWPAEMREVQVGIAVDEMSTTKWSASFAHLTKGPNILGSRQGILSQEARNMKADTETEIEDLSC